MHLPSKFPQMDRTFARWMHENLFLDKSKQTKYPIPNAQCHRILFRRQTNKAIAFCTQKYQKPTFFSYTTGKYPGLLAIQNTTH